MKQHLLSFYNVPNQFPLLTWSTDERYVYLRLDRELDNATIIHNLRINGHFMFNVVDHEQEGFLELTFTELEIKENTEEKKVYKFFNSYIDLTRNNYIQVNFYIDNEKAGE